MNGGAGAWRGELLPMRWWHVADVHRLESDLFGASAWSAETFWGELAQPGRTYLVAVDGDDSSGGAVLGYGGLARSGADADVQTIGVARGAQGRGVGRRLLRALLDAAREGGAGRVLLEVRDDNGPARALYRSEGFEVVARRARYYQPDGADALVLRVRL